MLKKLQQARAFIKAMPIKKAGKNTFSGYEYFTPEQINKMVWEAEQKAGLIHFFDLVRDVNGIHGRLIIADVETGDKVELVQATDIPLIKATNTAQQIGGAVTYTLRYMLMTAFDISDNSLDFDAHREQKSKPPMPKERFDKMLAYLNTRPQDAAEQLSKVRDQFTLNDAQESLLREWEDNL